MFDLKRETEKKNNNSSNLNPISNKKSIVLKSKRRRVRARRVFSIMAAVVVFATTYALILPAKTASAQAYCGFEEHQHSDACYEDTLICGMEESDTHQHDDSCYEQRLVCNKEEHTHDLLCYSNADADVETAEVWEATLPEESDLSGEATADLVAVAKSQIGYEESTENYEVAEDRKAIKGYTRYGEWNDEPYADWSMDFVAFCLYYADIAMPVDTEDQEKWISDLEKAELVKDMAVEDYAIGDIVFLEDEEDGELIIPHMGIVSAVDEKKITVIEGDCKKDKDTDAVVEKEYKVSTDQIVAAARLPEEGDAKAVETVPEENGTTDVESVSETDENNAVNDTAPENNQKDEDMITLSYDGEGYSVTASFAEDSGLDAETDLKVSEIREKGKKSETAEYEKYFEQAEAAVEDSEDVTGEISAARFFDITFEQDGEAVEPTGDVNITITLDETAEGDVNAIHLPEKEDAEVIKTSAEGNYISFTASSFSVYGVVYTVDFHHEVDGNVYEYSLTGGGSISLTELVEVLGIISGDSGYESAEDFVADVDTVEFSDPTLVEVEKTNDGDWTLTSLQPFDTEESLTITMENGDVVTIKVTDDQVSSLSEIDVNKEYILYTIRDGQYYVLKADGTTEVKSQSELDALDINYKWKINYIYTDQWPENNSYYHVIPVSDSHKSLALNWFEQPLVDDKNDNQIVIAPYGDAFAFYGYNHVTLSMSGDDFAGLHQRDGICLRPDHPGIYERYDSAPITIYEPAQLEQYRFNVNSSDYAMGKVCGTNDSNQYKEDAEFDTLTDNEKYNQYEIKAQPQTSRYMFDYWDLNGEKLDLGATIPEGRISIPYQGSKLTAHFKKDPNWVAPDDQKEGRVIDKESFQAWLKELRERNVPLNQEACIKTAEVYDYENRIYRVDLTAQSNLSMFDGDIDLGFIIDVSGSMQFPSKLIPIAGKEAVDVIHINDSYQTQHQLNTNKEYYVIVDRTNRADVLRLKWGHWPTGNPTSHSTQWYDGWGVCGLGWNTEEEKDASTRYLLAGNALFNGDDGPFQLYDVGDNGKQRKDYLESSIAGTITELNSILGDLAYAKNASEAANVKVAYNTFCATVGDKNHSFVPVANGLNINYDYKGGTSTWLALNDAKDFEWANSATKVAILITDGAPQETGTDGATLDTRVKTAAEQLKAQGIKLVTVGLSMGDVKRGSRLLYDIATKDSNGDPYFYSAESGDELQYALYEVIQQVMADAIVVGNVTDTVNEAFYPVDKDTGVPLEVGNIIGLDGVKLAETENGLTNQQKANGYGVIGKDEDGNYTITWTGQNFTWEGWHGTVYEKAKEDFLGGNAVRTNDPDTPAMIQSEGYKINPEDPTITFKPEIQIKGTKTLETPRVNVNELDLTDSKSEWTVYLGTKVDPKSQLQAFYDNILVKEVVTAAEDVDKDGFKDRMTGTSLYYPVQESISDKRESSASGEQVTFKLKDLLKELNNGNDITIDDLIDAEDSGITLPYALYGQDCPGAIVIKLAKKGDTSDYESHSTTVIGDAVETYDLTVDFKPDYEHVPIGQGGDGSKEYHTGNYSLGYQGNAAGEDYSTNNHIINVYSAPLDVYKTDESDEPLAGATFKLYKQDDANGSVITGMDKSHKYVEVASGISLSDGVAQLKCEDKPFGLVQGEIYYLIESSAPENYVKSNKVWTVEVQTEVGKYTDLDGKTIYSNTHPVDDKAGVTTDMYPFNWDQGARIVLDGNQPVTVIAKRETEGSTTEIKDGSYVSHKKAISFRHTVKNIGGNASIHVEKIWKTENDTPDSVTVKLYRVSEKDHTWGDGKIVPCTCTKEGVEEYTCSECGKTDARVISAAGHTAGEAHRENETIATCTTPGGYDTVVRCAVCNAVISSEHTEVSMSGHIWGEAQEVESADQNYCYDTVIKCTVCGEEKENSREHHAHEWGEWQVRTPAQPGVAGEQTRTCAHNATHTETQEIPALPNNTTITYSTYRDWYGDGWLEDNNVTTAQAYPIGSSITLSWNSSFAYDATVYINGSAVWDQQNGYKLYGDTVNVTRTGSYNNYTYSVTVPVTDGIHLFLKSNTWNDYPRSITITQNRSFLRSDMSMKTTTKSSLLSKIKTAGEQILKNNVSAQTAEDNVGSKTTTGTKTDPIQAYLETVPETAACKDGEGHIYKEYVKDYTITGSDWSLDVSGLPKYNEYGKEYTYYLVETPLAGYDTSYSVEESGLQDGGKLKIINTPKVTDLTVTKTWAFANPSNVTKVEGKDWPQGVTVHVTVYSKTGESDPVPTSYSVDLTADQPTYTFENLPEYVNGEKVEYSVVEAGVTGLDSTNFNTIIEGNAEDGYTIKNTEKEAGLTIIKAFEGASLTDNQKSNITFTVTGSGLKDRSSGKSVESLTKTYSDFVEGQWVLNQADGIVAGGTYTVTETNCNVDNNTRVTNVKVDEGNPTSFIQGDNERDPSGTITLDGNQGTIAFTNKYTKLVDLKIVKVDANGMITLLEGAGFELRKVDPENTTLSYLDDEATLPTTTGKDHKTGSDGKAIFEKLTEGYYEVKEVVIPDGYVQSGDGVFYIKVENGVISHVERTITVDDEGNSYVTWTPGSDNATFIFTASSGDESALAKVGNTPGAALPHTGGTGTCALYLIGAAVVAMAGIGLVMRRHRGGHV